MTPLCTLLFCLILAACKRKKNPKKGDEKKDRPVVVDVVIAVPKPLSNMVETIGTVIPNESTELRPEVSGRLTYLNVPEGKSVAQGTILARVNSADLEAQIARTKVQLETALKTEERLKKLLDINGINLSDYDAAVIRSIPSKQILPTLKLWLTKLSFVHLSAEPLAFGR
ncbi:MAG: biotin/lipoyl-binding protein [Spirosomataceae bacterium]